MEQNDMMGMRWKKYMAVSTRGDQTFQPVLEHGAGSGNAVLGRLQIFHEGDAQDVAALEQELHVELRDLRRQILTARVRVAFGTQGAALFQEGAQQLLQQLVLALEVVVDQGLVDLGALGDAVHAGAIEAFLGEFGACGVQDAGAGVGLVFGGFVNHLVS
jgi:hypothetical protein